ncbi:hypothetical protein OKA05_04545 [Luteolibacter arcticus]|uniref:Uncharacterized protein n=1 Tax=Luteolibacter arcticus TaxID=1581411 RepID=A0ABT3GDW4_9BACT|nr:hypothetical protein [Luteolibacter arcticus]MCW1921809.1 hypothetical protein [Luteolibacter arcticus]
MASILTSGESATPQPKMHSDQAPYSELLEQLDDCNEDGELEPVIGEWLRTHPGESAWIAGLKRVDESSGIPEMSVEDRWRLYALSRVSDALIERIGKDRGRKHHYTAFMQSLGLCEIDARDFHPFYHEVVEVTPSATVDAPITISTIAWPGFMCGPLMIARAGVSVTGGTMHTRKDIAEASTLYWCYRRAGRAVEDLSLGWGGNSQWRTAFRRDYRIGGHYFYNVDGENDPVSSLLDESALAELLRHRCFILRDSQHVDLYPYQLRHHEPVA